jgi:hypothetical protein
MADNMTDNLIENNDNGMKRKKIIRKAGRTIVLRTDLEFTPPENLTGIINHITVNNGKHFLVFDNIDNSKDAFKILKSNQNYSVRFAYYKLFFKMNGLDEKTDYSIIKKLHTDWIAENSEGNVLYYKQYKKDGKMLGCGDFTIDTKESMDKLLNKDKLKTYSFDIYSGTNYRYNKKGDTNEEFNEN